MVQRASRPDVAPAATPDGPSGVGRRTVLRLGGATGVLALLAGCGADGPVVTLTPSPSGSTWTPPGGPLAFPDGFRWGAATSAFQVEGSTTVDGRGVSIWDTFAARRGTVRGGATGDPAADHYRLWEQDLDLMVELGLGAYRFSVAWPRIQPTGSGPVEQRGVDFYARLVDGLLERGIHPAATLYHWDLPQPLQDAGGWEVRDTAARFAEYAAIMVDALGDREIDWLTINEPKTTAYVGHRYGAHAPGLHDVDAAVRAVHHQLLGHGLAVQAFRASGAVGGIGAALNLQPVYAAVSDPDAEPDAATLAAVRCTDAVENRLFLDPVLLGTYPDDAIGSEPGQLPTGPETLAEVVRDGDLAIISTPADHLAVQYYGVTAVDSTGATAVQYPTTDASWQQVHAEGLHETLTRLRDEYPAIPLLITENGIPDRGAEGTLQDVERESYLRDHLVQAARAVQDGVDLRGYYAWSLLDNFEWGEGYEQRWGLVHVDFETQVRTPKDSTRWFRTVIAANAVEA
ncbi:GH1 family beta-glucosidase [Cellulomonas sp. P22]|uniref:GH1 family beta-glucosidase n=1 Tax=Cellulomonas sp. P22 TaxID=3373189 RepID=UPI0037A181EB